MIFYLNSRSNIYIDIIRHLIIQIEISKSSIYVSDTSLRMPGGKPKRLWSNTVHGFKESFVFGLESNLPSLRIVKGST